MAITTVSTNLSPFQTFANCICFKKKNVMFTFEGRRGRKRRRQRMQSGLCADNREPDARFKLTDGEIMT